jgi:hypothetical protein
MSRKFVDEDDWEGDEEAWESDDEESEDWAADVDESEPTIPCPYCHRQIHEDSQRCPYCENYLSQEDAPPAPKPWWIILGVLACLFAVYLWISR